MNANSNCSTKIMDVDPVFKFPALLLATAALYYSFTPPTPLNVSEKAQWFHQLMKDS